MTAEGTARTAGLIREISETAAVIVVEHDMQFIRQIARTVTVFHQGRVIMVDVVDKVMRDPRCATSISARRRLRCCQDAAQDAGSEQPQGGLWRVPVLDGIALEVPAGSFLGILGNNGMGKTTLLRTSSATCRRWRAASASRARTSPPFRPRNAPARHGPGAAGREIFPNLSVIDNLRMGLIGGGRDEARELPALLELFPRLERLLERRGGALSGGEQQLLALARCLAAGPELILLDEPTRASSPDPGRDRRDPATAQAGADVTIVLVEQNLDFIAQLADRVLIINKGRFTGELQPASCTTCRSSASSWALPHEGGRDSFSAERRGGPSCWSPRGQPFSSSTC
jgi:branched-chain amino acid transport system ATP-binding protein/urea transport system ATP-binding protein